MKPQITFEAGKLNIQVAHVIDTDGDGKAAAEIAVQAKLDAAEVISEIAKKDMPWLENLLASLKV